MPRRNNTPITVPSSTGRFPVAARRSANVTTRSLDDPSMLKNKARQAREVLRDQKQRFDAAHRKGMKALQDADFRALDEAIAEESKIIREQGAVTKKAKKKR